MVKKSYRTLFKDPTGFKEKVLYCLFDLDKRIKEIMRVEDLEQIFSKRNHTHDTKYSSINHDHDEQYSPIGHNHDELYSPLNHTHTNIGYILPFTVSGNVVDLVCDFQPNDVFVLEDADGEIFSVNEIDGFYVSLTQEGADTNRVYHLMYNNNVPRELEEVNLSLSNINATRGVPMQVNITVTDSSNQNVTDGAVQITIAKNNDTVLSQTVNVIDGLASVEVNTNSYYGKQYTITARYKGTQDYEAKTEIYPLVMNGNENLLEVDGTLYELTFNGNPTFYDNAKLHSMKVKFNITNVGTGELLDTLFDYNIPDLPETFMNEDGGFIVCELQVGTATQQIQSITTNSTLNYFEIETVPSSKQYSGVNDYRITLTISNSDNEIINSAYAVIRY